MSDTPFTLLQISDCHLCDAHDGLYKAQSPDENILRLLPALKATKPDGIVLTGDVAEQGDRAAYERAATYFHALAPHKAWIPGNHDDRSMMSEVLSNKGFVFESVLLWGQWRLVLLDSVIDNDPAGELDDEAIALLMTQAKSDQPTLVFIHHPPLPVGAAWIDKYPLKNPQALMEAIDSNWVKAVCFGHVHQVFSETRAGVQYLSAPATSVNSQSGFDVFTPDPTGPKARWFKLWPNGRWATGVISAG